MSSTKMTSVFNALGSYADRTREAAAAEAAAAAAAPNGLKSPTATLASSSPRHAALPVVASASSSVSPSPAPSSAPNGHADDEGDGGAWETVQAGRQKTRAERGERQDDSRANRSRNWRERDERASEPASATRERPMSALPEPERSLSASASTAAKTTKAGAVSAAPGEKARAASSGPATESAARAVAATPTAPPKSVWGVVTPVASALQLQATPASATSTTIQTPKAHSQTAPSSPTHGATTASSISVPPSLASPNLSADTESTAATSLMPKTADSTDDEGSWRARGKVSGEPKLPPPKQPAPPPAVNAWAARQQRLAPAVELASNGSASAAPAAPVLQFGSVDSGPSELRRSAEGVNGEVRTTKKVVKKNEAGADTRSKGAAAAPPLADATAWPDVAQAAGAAKELELKKGRKESDTSSMVDEPTAAAGKKQKWTPIPAAELQAAADKAAESSGRGSGKRGGRAGEESTRGRKPALARTARPTRAGSADEMRSPPHPEHTARAAGGFKLGANVMQQEPADLATANTGAPPTANGLASSAPLSRQTSRQSASVAPRHSPQRPTSNVSSPEKRVTDLDGGRPLAGGMPPHSFMPHAGRAPRGRGGNDMRGGYRGRGGFRNGGGPMGAPRAYAATTDDVPPAFQRAGGMSGYGAPAGGFYPMQGYMPSAPMHEAQGQPMGVPIYGRPGLPPPPMPATLVPNLDPLRFYVLGQVEYYFSMQNLAMDFFLRQQMDSDGWIDVAMIASFNRVKSLTPDVSVVHEVMTLSSLLEVREDKVRLAGGEARRWVLPDAKPSRFANGSDAAGDASAATPAAVGQAGTAALAMPSNDIGDNKDIAKGVPSGLTGDEAPVVRDIATDVESALLKNVGEPRSDPLVGKVTSAATGKDEAEQGGHAQANGEKSASVAQEA